MDWLASMQLTDLPEQQTRTVELMEKFPDFDLSMGFDACCSCGQRQPFLSQQPQPQADLFGVMCPHCRRVMYCSEECRLRDANVVIHDTDDDQALGHTVIVCSLLNLCHHDEAVVEGGEKGGTVEALDDAREHEKAVDRVQSEKESYPATLANVLLDGPCYQQVLLDAGRRRQLVLHVVGASVDSEFWGSEETDSLDAYADALAELAQTRGLDVIELVFIGLECPANSLHESKRLNCKSDETPRDLLIRSYQASYSRETLTENSISEADIVVFFNPGFTVPDYDWKDALASIPNGTPFLSTTNTELEGIADCQFLLDQDRIQTLPPGMADIFGVYSENDSSNSFFSVNPFAGNRVRQSGTMANDLYVKNRWILGGILDSFDPTKGKDDEPVKRHKVGVFGNTKDKNPALI